MEGQQRTRKFRQIKVGKCHAQTATDRFGDGARAAIRDRERAAIGMHPHNTELPFTWPGQESDDENGCASIYRLVPSMQKFRNNLTALAQSCNLYFVAYQGRIFVYKPRSAPNQIIPRHPDLQLTPRRSASARQIRGHLDSSRPHSVNHIKTGYIGRKEILVACYDDGDVVAYYIEEVEACVSALINGTGIGTGTRTGAGIGAVTGTAIPSAHAAAAAAAAAAPKEFLHENVGKSAWGICVHAKSRLIAISSNRHEVTVFALALARKHQTAWQESGALGKDRPDVSVLQRARNWRIVLVPGSNASNMPNVCFVDDARGNAEKVCAIDVNGAVWLMDIFKMYQSPIYIPPLCTAQLKSEEFFPSMSSGWAVLMIPERFFMQVKTTEELFGMPVDKLEVVRVPGCRDLGLANVGKTLANIPDNPCLTPFAASSAAAAAAVAAAAAAVFNIEPIPVNMNPNEIAAELEAQVDTPPGVLNDESEEEDEGTDEIEEDTDPNGEDQSDEPEGPDDDASESGEAEDSDDSEAAPNGDEITNAPPPQPALPYMNSWPTAMASEPSSDDFLDSLDDSDRDFTRRIISQYGRDPHESTNGKPNGRSSNGRRQSQDNDAHDGFPGRHNMIFFPHSGTAHVMPSHPAHELAFLSRQLEYNGFPRADERSMSKFSHKLHLFRTYEKDIEMRGFPDPKDTGNRSCGVVCPDVLKFGRYRDVTLRHHFHETSRLPMVAMMPELSIVVVGSPIGRVAILTLTRKATPTEQAGSVWQHGFRVESILPRQSDEDVHRKTLRPLHGVAVGPVQVGHEHGDGSGANKAALPHKYRLMLHYRNHDILTYEITREEETDKLCIF